MQLLYVLARYYLAIDKIKINLFVFNSISEESFKLFFFPSKKFDFIYQKKIQPEAVKNNLLLIIPSIFDKNNILSKLDIFLKDNFDKISLFIPKSKTDLFKKNKIKIFSYPIKIQNFEEQLYKFYSSTSHRYKNLSLVDEDLLILANTNKKINLTEIESKIIKFLFKNIKVPKHILNFEVLNQKKELESKSLETHLSRLRKKILQLDKSIKIISNKKKEIQII